MKKYLFVVALSAFSFVTASAQNDRSLRNDPTYSTHNYKHPNKAAAARQWENKSAVAVEAPGISNAPMASYKHPVPGATPTGGVKVAHTPTMDVALHNYKIQRVSLSRPTTQSASDVADRKASSPISE